MTPNKTILLAGGVALIGFLVLKSSKKAPLEIAQGDGKVADPDNAQDPGKGFEGPSLPPMITNSTVIPGSTPDPVTSELPDGWVNPFGLHL